jgi:hypothetical protein
MPCSDRITNQRRVNRLYEAKSTPPSLLRALDMNAFSASRTATGPKGGPGLKTHQTKPNRAPTSTGSFDNLSSNGSVGTVSTEVLSVTSPAKDSQDGYFPFDVKPQIVLPVMPRDVTHGFALTAVGQWLDNF